MEPWGALGKQGSPGPRGALETEPCSKPRARAWEKPCAWRGLETEPRSKPTTLALEGRWEEEHDPICKPKPGQAVGEFRGQRSAKP